MKRALVLGGGGVIGVEWEAGLARGLCESGFALDGLDAVVGTSAGAMVGSYLANGKVPAVPAERRAQYKAAGAGQDGLAVLDREKLDVQALGKIFSIWAAIELTTAEQAASIGKIVCGLDRSAEPRWIAQAHAAAGGASWPERRLLVIAVDAESGERRVFERGDGVPLERAVAASSAVPGLFPAVEIGGRLYMDGQVHSSTNADLLLPYRPAQVLIAAPTNGFTGRGIGPHAERMLAQEVAALRAAGCDVRVKTPSSEDAQRLGNNLMDHARVQDAYDVGLETGRAWAEEL